MTTIPTDEWVDQLIELRDVASVPVWHGRGRRQSRVLLGSLVELSAPIAQWAPGADSSTGDVPECWTVQAIVGGTLTTYAGSPGVLRVHVGPFSTELAAIRWLDKFFPTISLEEAT